MLASALVRNSPQMKAPMIFSACRTTRVSVHAWRPPCQQPPAAACPRPRSRLLAPPSTAAGPQVKVLRPLRPLLRAPACRTDSSTQVAYVLTAVTRPLLCPLDRAHSAGLPSCWRGAVSVAGPQLFSSAGTRARTVVPRRGVYTKTLDRWMDVRTEAAGLPSPWLWPTVSAPGRWNWFFLLSLVFFQNSDGAFGQYWTGRL